MLTVVFIGLILAQLGISVQKLVQRLNPQVTQYDIYQDFNSLGAFQASNLMFDLAYAIVSPSDLGPTSFVNASYLKPIAYLVNVKNSSAPKFTPIKNAFYPCNKAIS